MSIDQQGTPVSDGQGWWAFIVLLALGAVTTPFFWMSGGRHDQPASPTPKLVRPEPNGALPHQLPSPLRPLEEFWCVTDPPSEVRPSVAEQTPRVAATGSENSGAAHASGPSKAELSVEDLPIDWPAVKTSQTRLLAFRKKAADGWSQHYQLETMIVCVPDPEYSHLGYCLDTLLTAIQSAVLRMGFVPGGHVMPWKRLTSEDREERAAQSDAERPSSWREPGAILFRNIDDSNPQRLLLVFFVGESPVTGIQGEAFVRSVWACRWLEQTLGHGNQLKHTLRVLGPAYSGSGDSVRELMGRLNTTHAKMSVQMISGSAESLDTKKITDAVNADAKDLTFFDLKLSTLPRADVTQELFKYLKKLNGGRMPRTAMLVETSTGYGGEALGSPLMGDSEDDKDAGDRGGDRMMHTRIPFPLHVSRLQSHYERLRADAAARAGAPRENALPVDFEEARISPDTMSPFSPGMTAVMLDRMLDNVLTTLVQDDFRYVGIIATDARDKLFLANLVRAYCPDAQLITIGSDLLLTHPDYLQSLKGALIASPYPLYLRNQLWTHALADPVQTLRDRKRIRLQFASQADQGCCNAACALLCRPDLMIDYATPFEQPHDGACLPAIWLSMVGNNNLAPILFFPQERDRANGDSKYKDIVYPAKSKQNASRAQDYQLNYSTASLLFILGACLVTLWTCITFGVVRGRELYALWALRDVPAQPRELAFAQMRMATRSFARNLWRRRVGRIEQGIYIGVCLVALLVISLELVKVALIPVAHQGSAAEPMFSDYAQRILVWAVAGCAVTACAAALTSLALLPLFATRHAWRLWTTPIVIALALPGFWFLLIHPRASPWLAGVDLLYFQRATDIREGLSPLMPIGLLAGAIFWWAVFQLRRLRVIDRLNVRSPLPTRLLGADLRDAEVVELLRAPWRSVKSWSWVGIAAATAVVMLRLHRRFLPTQEGWQFDWTCQICFAVVVSLIVFTLLQFHRLWRRLNGLLSQIYALPMHQAWDRLPQEVARIQGQFLDAREPRLEQFRIAVHQAKLLLDSYDSATADPAAPEPATPKELKPAELKFPPELKTADSNKFKLRIVRPGDGKVLTSERTIEQAFRRELRIANLAVSQSEVQVVIADLARQCAERLAKVWRTEPASVAYRRYTTKLKRDTRFSALPKPLQQWYRDAEDFFAVTVVLYIGQYFVVLRSLLASITCMSVLLLLSITSYPFQPQRLLLIGVMSLLIGVVITVSTVFLKLNRDSLTSRIAKLVPDRVTFDRSFLTSMATYVVPLVVIVGAQFGNLFGALLTFFDPILRALR